MQDPSQGIHRDLLPHIHLLSTFRFPASQNLHPGKVTEWLLNAPKIVRDQAPFFWSYLDRPADGTIMLSWQAEVMGNPMGNAFPTDGYIWPPVESVQQHEVEGGYVLETCTHKTGYAPGEPVATHARHRYRLISKYPHPAAVVTDSNLWITHYSAALPADRVPSNIIPIAPRTQELLQTRMYLQTQGQIVQKEFMLHDRSNWPRINFPANSRAMAYPGGPMRMQQPVPYPAGPPAKRPRTQANAPVPQVDAFDSEEETARGDEFDNMTPREISKTRYKLNHEWMEEILSSHFTARQILPVELGLGLKGELTSLTDGVFDGYISHLAPGKADEFRKRTTERFAETNAEMEKMKAKHAKRLAKFKKGGLIMEAEKELREAVHNPKDVGPEYWRLEGRVEDSEEEKEVKILARVDEIVARVEATLGKHTAAVEDFKRIQDGGLEETVPEKEVVMETAPEEPEKEKTEETTDWVVVPEGGESSPAQEASLSPETFNPEPVDFGSLDLDTAGDALAEYGAEDLGDDLDLGLMDDSAFGDAFHGVEERQDGDVEM